MLEKNKNFDEKVNVAWTELRNGVRDLLIHYWTSLELQLIKSNEFANSEVNHNLVVFETKVEIPSLEK